MGKTKHWLPKMWKFNTINMQWWKVYAPYQKQDNQFVVAVAITTEASFSATTDLLSLDINISNRALTDLHIYWISNNTWQTQTTRLAPQPRRYHSISSCTETVAFLFGGGFKRSECSNCLTALNDLWMPKIRHWNGYLFITTAKQETISCSPNATRDGHHHHVGTKIYLYSGYDTYDQVLNDLWQYDILGNSWKVVETVNLGLVTLSLYWTLLATTVGNQMIMTLGCFDKQSKLMQVDRCNVTKPQETWLYSPENKRSIRISSTQTLSDVFGAQSGPSTPLMYDQGSLVLLNVVNVLDRARIYYMTFACPEGYYSNNTISEPCRPCPIDKYSDLQRSKCKTAPTN